MSQKPRAFEMSIEIDAPVDAVWQALTDAETLTKWFPTNARVEPAPGGRFRISWDGDWQWDMSITDWEPLKRLRMVDRQARPFDADGKPIGNAAPVDLVLDFTLESRGTQALLRLDHSGFGHGASWDDELDGVSLGWNVELRGLRHYLERHRNQVRHLGWARASSDLPLEVLWSHLTSPSGLIAEGAVEGLRAADRCAFTLTTGDPIDGHVVFAHPGRQLVVAAANFGDGLLRLSLDRAAGRSMANVWLSEWARPEGEARAFEVRAQAALDQALRGALSNRVALAKT